MPYLRPYIALSVTILIALASTYTLFPESREQLYEEDQLIENVTVAIYLSVVIGAAVGLVFVRGNANRSVMLLFLGLGILTALEETSYGERFFGFTPPEILDYKMDTLHDFFFLFFKVIKDLAEAYGFFVYAVFAVFVGLAALFLYRKREPILKVAVGLLRCPPLFYIGLFIALGLTALMFDLRILKLDVLQAVEEGLEMSAALALAFGCFTVFKFQTND